MNYEIIEREHLDGVKKHVIIDNGDGSFKSFPAEADNPVYQAFLETLEGNEPEVIDG